MSSRPRRSDEIAASRRGWTLLRLAVPVELADEAVGLLAVESCGASCDPLGPTTTEIRLYFETPEAARRALDAVPATLAGLGQAGPPAALHLEPVPVEPWVERFQAGLTPFDLGSGFRVHPRAVRRGASPIGGRIPIHLSPGRAFGTGEHPTTALCAELVERRVRPGAAWLDLGCGTAILAVVAARLGAGEVRAVDVDPEAIAVARRVVARNSLADRVRVVVGSIEAAADRRWDGVVSNVELPFFLEGTAEIAALLAPRGRLIVSGILAEDLPVLSQVFRHAGLHEAAPRIRGEWAALELTAETED